MDNRVFAIAYSLGISSGIVQFIGLVVILAQTPEADGLIWNTFGLVLWGIVLLTISFFSESKVSETVKETRNRAFLVGTATFLLGTLATVLSLWDAPFLATLFYLAQLAGLVTTGVLVTIDALVTQQN